VLKVILLADSDKAGGGLNEASRRRAWQLVHELGVLLMTDTGKEIRH
jgi:hypothetical protein